MRQNLIVQSAIFLVAVFGKQNSISFEVKYSFDFKNFIAYICVMFLYQTIVS